MMTIEEMQKWLDECPTHKWEIVYDEGDTITISFPIDEEES